MKEIIGIIICLVVLMALWMWSTDEIIKDLQHRGGIGTIVGKEVNNFKKASEAK